MIPSDFIDELLERTDIVEIIGQRVALKKQGQNHTGLCPFHSEKTPSFSVSADKQFYYCFGCQASGSALKFLMEADQLDFVAAVELLASRAGMEVPRSKQPEPPERTERRKSIYAILEEAAAWYKEQLRHHPQRQQAVSYLQQRGLSGEVARDFGLGYAPPGWDNLNVALARTNHERGLLIDSGMVVVNEESEKEHDRFRDRIMFPIRDNRGRVIAFGGRVMGDTKPKYLNSPETTVFHKGRELYGLYEARHRNRKLDQLMVVEGYMDVVALAQHGISYCVATLGTATSEAHVDRLFRVVSKLVFCFDGDTAGRNAAWKALQVCLPYLRDGRSARFLFLPDGEDPDSLVRAEGSDKLERRIVDAPHLPDVFFNKLLEDTDAHSLDGKAALAKSAMPLIDSIPAGMFKQLMLQRLSELTGLAGEKLLENWAPRHAATRPAGPPARTYGRSMASSSRQSGLTPVNSAVSMLLHCPELAAQFDASVYGRLADTSDFKLLLSVVEAVSRLDIRSTSALLGSFQGTPEFEQLCELAEQEPLLPVADLPDEFGGTINKLIRRLESESIQEVRAALLAKPFADLTRSERDMLRDLTRANRGQDS